MCSLSTGHMGVDKETLNWISLLLIFFPLAPLILVLCVNVNFLNGFSAFEMCLADSPGD